MQMAPGSKIAILGLRSTGFLSASFLHKKGYQIFASDLADTEDIRENVSNLLERGILAECGKHSLEAILAADGILISPGIPPQSKIYRAILAAKKPIYSEIEIASWFSPAKTVVAITGSCGKTTVATLITRIVEAGGRKSVLCGNIGNPWIGELSRIGQDTVVILEISSFQLMHCMDFAPSVGLLLNIYPNHMDWHADMTEYARAKLNLFRTMKNTDVMICRKKDESEFFQDFRTAARRIYLDEHSASDPNEAALLCVAEALNLSKDLVREAMLKFRGIEHRLEKFAEREGIIFFNDSKATTTASLAWALKKFSDGTVVLICGGKHKTDVHDFKSLRTLIAQKVRCAILIGSARPIMKEAWQGIVEMAEAENFDEACRLSIEKAQKGDVVLLSPACASFDMFKNYQERGRLFKEKILNRLKTIGSRLKREESCEA